MFRHLTLFASRDEKIHFPPVIFNGRACRLQIIGLIRSCAPIFYLFKDLEGCDAKLHFLFDIVGRYFDSYDENSGGECHGGRILRSSNGGSSF